MDLTIGKLIDSETNMGRGVDLNHIIPFTLYRSSYTELDKWPEHGGAKEMWKT